WSSDVCSSDLAYAQHVYKAQGLTCERALVLTGGWQTDRERAYVALSRARERTDIHLARTDIGEDDTDKTAIDRLSEVVARSNAQHASISRQEPASERASGRPVDRPRPAPAAKPECEDPRNQQALDRGSAGHAPEPFGRVGRLLREQQERQQGA